MNRANVRFAATALSSASLIEPASQSRPYGLRVLDLEDEISALNDQLDALSRELEERSAV